MMAKLELDSQLESESNSGFCSRMGMANVNQQTGGPSNPAERPCQLGKENDNGSQLPFD